MFTVQLFEGIKCVSYPQKTVGLMDSKNITN